MAVQNNQIWTGLQALPTFDLYAQLYLQPLDPIRANYSTIPYKNLQLGTFWLNTRNQNLWYLASLTPPPHVEGNWIQISGSSGNVETLTGNSGGAVSSDASGNINVIGDGIGITIAGNPATNTLTASLVGGGVATQSYITSPATGTATPDAAGQLTFAGAGGIVVSAAANTVTITGGGSIAQSFPADSGTATPAAGVLNILSGRHTGANIATLGAGNTVTVEWGNTANLGDQAVLAAGAAALTVASGDIILTASDQAAATNQMIRFKTNTGQDGNISMFLNNIFIGQGAGNTTGTPGVTIFNIGIGPFSCSSLTTGQFNTGIGNATLQNCTTGTANVAFGYTALIACTTGGTNTAVGNSALGSLTTSSGNVAIGSTALSSLVTGANNIAIGNAAGTAYTGAESGNILIGSVGVVGESNVTKIAGIRGITTNVNDAVAVLIDSAGQLGTVSSSARFKENIETMNGASDAIMYLRPVTFNYKSDEHKRTNYGLIAEEVAQVMPNLVVYDEMDEPETVRYHELVPMLLNEVQKQRKLIMDLISHVGVLEQDVQRLKAKKKS